MPSQKVHDIESAARETGSNGFEYDCEPRSGVLTVEEMNEMASPDVLAIFDARQKSLAACQNKGKGSGDDGRNDRIASADALAVEAHARQFRKGGDIPYIEHPRGVAVLVKAYGGNENQQIAALLHDVLEDGGAEYLERVAAFGPDVLRMVRDCSDCVPVAGTNKPPWQERKDAYLAHLQTVQDDSLLVSACDKLYNLGTILEDFALVGEAVFDRFSVPKGRTVWYYRELGRIFATRRPAPAVIFFAKLEELNRLA
jgi:(p)ppGpp synthase/HD superfamily hydrolase